MCSWWTYSSISSVVMPGRTISPARRRISAATAPARRMRAMTSGDLMRGSSHGIGCPVSAYGGRAMCGGHGRASATRRPAAPGPRCACGSACTCARCRTSTGRWPAAASRERWRRCASVPGYGVPPPGPRLPSGRDAVSEPRRSRPARGADFPLPSRRAPTEAWRCGAAAGPTQIGSSRPRRSTGARGGAIHPRTCSGPRRLGHRIARRGAPGRGWPAAAVARRRRGAASPSRVVGDVHRSSSAPGSALLVLVVAALVDVAEHRLPNRSSPPRPSPS